VRMRCLEVGVRERFEFHSLVGKDCSRPNENMHERQNKKCVHYSHALLKDTKSD
jgi:hypothetical protein